MTTPVAAAPASAMDEFVARYADDPVLFAYEVLGIELDVWQQELARAYARGDRRIAVRSGHGVGKTAAFGVIIVHQATFRFPQKTVVTAATEKQLYDALYNEVVKWIRKLPAELQKLFVIKSEVIEHAFAPEESFISFRTSRAEKPEALAGVHCDPGYVLLVVDEGSGVPDAVFEGASGSMSGHNCQTIIAGNPVRPVGFFYDIFHKLKDMWTTYHVSCFDSKRVTPDFIEDMKRRYGINSNRFRVRVLGEFPESSEDTIIPRDAVESAWGREVTVLPHTPIVWGLDCAAGGGDFSVLTKRKGAKVLEPQTKWDEKDVMVLAGRVKAEWDNTYLPDRPVEILVDAIGLGLGVAHRLQEQKLPAIAVNVSELPAVTSGQYRNLRTELWFAAADWFKRRECSIPENEDDELAEELYAQEVQIMDSSGKQWATPKKIMAKKGLGRSPDRADSLILTFAGLAGRMNYGNVTSTDWGKALERGLKGIV